MSAPRLRIMPRTVRYPLPGQSFYEQVVVEKLSFTRPAIYLLLMIKKAGSQPDRPSQVMPVRLRAASRGTLKELL
jgi:hypothetical protein